MLVEHVGAVGTGDATCDAVLVVYCASQSVGVFLDEAEAPGEDIRDRSCCWLQQDRSGYLNPRSASQKRTSLDKFSPNTAGTKTNSTTNT